jgi:large subunit ribosomal protein L25
MFSFRFWPRIVMAEILKLQAQPRDGRGSQRAKQLRRKGLVPAVLYGHKEATVALALATDELRKAIRLGTHIIDLQTGKSSQTALIKEVQWDYLGKELLHVDFARVAADERVTVTVPLEIRGTARGIAEGGVLDQPLHALHLECPVISIPASIRVNVSDLQLGQALHVRDLVLPEGVKAMDDPDAIVVHVTVKQVAPEAAPAAPAAAEQAEPELIGRKPAAEEEAAE